jgi:hypothetical protein
MGSKKENKTFTIVDIKETKYLVFVKKQIQNKKTYDVTIFNKTDEHLGDIYWRTGWRTYVVTLQPEIDFDIKCWNDVSDYLNTLLEERSPNKTKKEEFLVVYEDMWNNKENIRTEKIGDAIKHFQETYSISPENEIDYDKYNSDNPYDTGTTGIGFYDIEVVDEEGEFAGKIMIFAL